MSPALLTALGALAASFVAALFGYINSTKANRPAESNAQLAWVKQAQDEATAARTEAKEAKVESSAARAESEATRQQQVILRREMAAMQDWVDRVIRARDSFIADHPIESIDDSGVIRMLRAVNGGPHLAGE